MRHSQPEVADNVIRFVPRPRLRNRISAVDREEIAQWQGFAAEIGFDRIVIEPCGAADHHEAAELVAVHRAGEAWAQYYFARKGDAILAWCGVSSADIGEFATLGLAFQHVLAKHAGGGQPVCPPAYVLQAVVTDLLPRLRRAAAG